tara:strand:+ start:320 stop:661 length:342 start_codon:yes stop_codon:yes gene_type:complete
MARSDYTHRTVNGERVDLTESEIDACVTQEEEWAKGAADRAWQKIREERNRRLFETDYFALSDLTLADNMKTYRVALRDLPANTSDPVAFQNQWNEFEQGKDGVSDPWPVKPE